MPWIDANGVSLRYDVSGDGDLPLVLVHEMGGSLESWDEIAPAFATRCKILRYDLRGHGQSEKIRGPYLIADAVRDLAALLDHLKISTSAVIAGCALGGGIAMEFTATQPQRVRALIAMAPAIGVKPPGRDAMLKWAATIEAEGMRRFVDEEMLVSAWPPALRSDPQRFAKFRARQLANDPSSYAATQRMLGECDVAAKFGDIHCPALLIAGTHDVARPPAFVAGVAEQLANAQAVTLESGHFMLVQTPDLVSAAMSRFIDETLLHAR